MTHRALLRHLVVILVMVFGFYTENSFASTSKKILIHGDSLSAGYGIPLQAGWVSLMESRLVDEKRPYTITNTSLSGETTAGGKQRFDLILKREHADIVILELGANDGLRGLDLKQMESNLVYMIEASQTSGAQVLLLGIKIPPNYGPMYTKQFELVYSRLAKQYNIAFVPFFLEGVAGNPSYIQADGLHPNSPAQTLILENVWNALHPLLSK